MPNAIGSKDPEYLLVISAIKQCILDAMDGSGPNELDWLMQDLPQAALQILLNTDDLTSRITTTRARLKMKAIIRSGNSKTFRQLLGWRKDADALYRMMQADDDSA